MPIDLVLHFQNYKHFLGYFGFYLWTAVYSKNQYLGLLFIYLFICKVITTKKFFCFYKQCSQAATRLICELGTFAQNASIISLALIYLCILKRIPWKNYVRLWKWNIKSTSQSAKIRFPENQIETFALIQHDFIR